MKDEIFKTEQEILQLVQKLEKLRKESTPEPVKNYHFQTLDGERTLLDLFAGRETLLLIHNMGQGCRWCTLWGDGISPFLPHLEEAMSVVMVSKDAPELQRQFANSRGWRFRMASHAGGEYSKEQTVMKGEGNMPGVVCYVRQGDKIMRKNASIFGPGDLYCSAWHFLSLAGIGLDEFTPQFQYWKRPNKMDDGGSNLI